FAGFTGPATAAQRGESLLAGLPDDWLVVDGAQLRRLGKPDASRSDPELVEQLLRVSEIDSHQSYRPQCYRRFSFLSPFFLVGVIDSRGQTAVWIYQVDAYAPAELGSLVGSEIVMIDGIPAETLIEQYAERYGKKSSPGSRWQVLYRLQVPLDATRSL